VIGADRHRPDQLLQIAAMLFAVAESDPNAFLGFVVVGISIDRHRGGVVVAGLGLDLKGLNHVSSDQHFQIPDAKGKQGIQRVGQRSSKYCSGSIWGKSTLSTFFSEANRQMR